MIRFLLKHPVGVLLTFLGLTIFSAVAFFAIPVSLLPAIEIPRINLYFEYPNAAPQKVEKQVLEEARARLITLSHLEDIRTVAESGLGRIELIFEYGTDMKLAYLETSEQADRLTEVIPAEVSRPLVTKASTSDIPLVRLQAVPRSPSDYASLSEVVEKVVKRRLEQLKGVSFVDINGLRRKTIFITLKPEALQAYQITADIISTSIREYNQPLGAVSVRDGIYRYYLKIEATLQGKKEVENIPVGLPEGSYLPLKELASVSEGILEPAGYHLFNGRDGFVITIHKQTSANMLEVMEAIKETLPQLQSDFPSMEFSFTQDQSALLEASIGNLTTSLSYGAAFAFLVLFLFTGNFQQPFVMGISIPVSLIISLLFFYLSNISINIISLSGLALGVGMLVDNAIVIIDNIATSTEKKTAEIAAATGAMFTPLLSSALTTLAVFVPLIFLSGLTGALFYDQAISISIILTVSLLVSFVLIPVLYQMILRSGHILKPNSALYNRLASRYDNFFHFTIGKPWLVFFTALLLLSSGMWLGASLPRMGLPAITQDDFAFFIDWNEPVTATTNRDRCVALSGFLADRGSTEIQTGISTFLLKQDHESLTTASGYFKNNGGSSVPNIKAALMQWMESHYPYATIHFANAASAFSTTFASKKNYWELHVQPLRKEASIKPGQLSALQEKLSKAVPGIKHGLSNQTETSLEITVLYDRLFLYDIDPQTLFSELKRWVGNAAITDIKNIGETIPVLYRGTTSDFESLVASLTISNKNNVKYPLHLFVDIKQGTEYKAIYGGKTGPYYSFYTTGTSFDYDEINHILSSEVEKGSFLWNFDGQFFENQALLREVLVIMGVSFILLYFILAAQFESLWQPLLVIITLPLGLSGSLLFLWIGRETVNIMAGIGMVVMLGIMVNDAILKVDTINRIVKTTPISSKEELIEILHKAGVIRLKPILMTTITTVLAVTPILFSNGLGADLQKPFVLALVGGLITGTFTALWLVPALFYQIKSQHFRSHS